MDLPKIIFLLKSATANFYSGETNNLAASSKRADVIMRCILAAIKTDGKRDRRFGCWTFFPFGQEEFPQNSILFDQNSFLPENIDNEIKLFSLLKPIILEPKNSVGNNMFSQADLDINIFNGDYETAVSILDEQGYQFRILEEDGTDINSISANKESEKSKVVYIIGDQIGNSEDLIGILKKKSIKYGKYSLGPISYLSSQCINLLKMIHMGI